MTCWNGHILRMNEAQMRQALDAYYQAYDQAWQRRMAQQWWVPGAAPRETPERQQPRRRTALEEARPGDKVDVLDVEFVRVR